MSLEAKSDRYYYSSRNSRDDKPPSARIGCFQRPFQPSLNLLPKTINDQKACLNSFLARQITRVIQIQQCETDDQFQLESCSVAGHAVDSESGSSAAGNPRRHERTRDRMFPGRSIFGHRHELFLDHQAPLIVRTGVNERAVPGQLFISNDFDQPLALLSWCFSHPVLPRGQE